MAITTMDSFEQTPEETSAPVAFDYIDTREGLASLLEALPAEGPLAVDTEADSMHHYHEKVCLMQITAGESHWLVDLLAPIDFGPLFEALGGRLLYFHGADYDVRLLYRHFGFQPTQIFDTMLAAQLLGKEQIGLAALVEEYCGVVLSKFGQRADWSKRPISDKLLRYAVDDTRYLATVVESVREELEALGRTEWHCESCQRVLDNAMIEKEPDLRPHLKLKGAGKLERPALGVLRELWIWRDRIAERIDRPPFMVFSTQAMLEWTQWAIKNPDLPFNDAPNLPRNIHGRRLENLKVALGRGLKLPDPPRNQGRKKEDKNNRRRVVIDPEELKTLMQARDKVAAALQIQPGVLASKDSLKEVLIAKPDSPDAWETVPQLMRWQGQQLAPALTPILDEIKQQ